MLSEWILDHRACRLGPHDRSKSSCLRPVEQILIRNACCYDRAGKVWLSNILLLNSLALQQSVIWKLWDGRTSFDHSHQEYNGECQNRIKRVLRQRWFGSKHVHCRGEPRNLWIWTGLLVATYCLRILSARSTKGQRAASKVQCLQKSLTCLSQSLLPKLSYSNLSFSLVRWLIGCMRVTSRLAFLVLQTV